MSYFHPHHVRYVPTSVPPSGNAQPKHSPYDAHHDHNLMPRQQSLGYVESHAASGSYHISGVQYSQQQYTSWPQLSTPPYYAPLPPIARERTGDAQPFHEAISQPADEGLRPCLWRRCYIMLDDHTAGGIRRHLLDCHTNDLLPGDAGRSGAPGPIVCRWALETAGHTCGGSYMSTTTLSRHISSSHMGVGRVTCEWCQTEFSRKDALKRHQKGNCPWRPDKETAGAGARNEGASSRCLGDVPSGYEVARAPTEPPSARTQPGGSMRVVL